MILLSSLIFVLLFYVIPMELVLIVASKHLGDWKLTEMTWLATLNIIAYLVILLVVVRLKSAYEFFEGHRESHYKKLKGFLDLRGSRWINLYGLILIAGGTLFFLFQGLIPFPFWFLFAAIVIGLLDVFYKDELLPFRHPLPEHLDWDELQPRDRSEADEIDQRFNWHYEPLPMMGETREYTETFRFLKSDYEAARMIDRHDEDYPRYIHDGLGPDLKKLAQWFRSESDKRRLTPLGEVENVVAFVRSIRYETDQVTHGLGHYSNYPIETLAESSKGSDCEDHAILAAALLHYLGHPVALFLIEMEESSHLALGYAGIALESGYGTIAPSGNFYAYYETVPTSNENRFGDICQQWLKELKQAKILEIVQ
ncbi:hypothetical protein N9496_06890 [Akkermansiaceae bacterium]|nr:hypothetical protein [Akkermansiaceae bacterium]